MTASDRERLIAAYLLEELDGSDRAEFERRLATDARLRAELEDYRSVVAGLRDLPAEAWDPIEAPPLALPVAELPGEQSRAPATRQWWRRPAFALASLAAVVVAVVAVVIASDGDDSQSRSVALRALGGNGGSGELTIDEPGAERAELRVEGLAPSRAGYYEVWLLGDRGLVSLGSFRVGGGGSADVDLQVPVDASDYESFDVSLEPDDGDPGHSGDSVLRAPTAS